MEIQRPKLKLISTTLITFLSIQSFSLYALTIAKKTKTENISTVTSTAVAAAAVATTTDETLFTTQTPSTTANSDGSNVNYELGMKFTSTIAGKIKSIRFYKSASESGTHTGKIYSAAGTLLASVAFTGETTSGWQAQALATPLAILANTTYVVSVNTGNSYYVATDNGMATQIVSGHLKSIVGSNGVYGSVGAMPTSSYQNSNYFRDVLFAPTVVVADTTAPSVAITNPLAGTVKAGTITATATATDNVGVVGVQFKLNGVNVGSEDLTSPYSLSIDTTKYTNGSYTLSAVARDAAGNTTTAQSAFTITNVVADTTLPVVAITNPLAGTVKAGTITASATATDNVGVVGVQFKLNGVNVGAEELILPYTMDIDTTKYANGSYTLSAVARDAAGNTATAQSVFTITNAVADTTLPVVAITNPLAGTVKSGTITATATATDNIGVAGVQFKLNGVNVGSEVLTSPYSVSIDTTKYTNGSYTISAVARDAAANTATAQAAFTITNTVSAANNFYIAQSSAGTNDGLSCANAHAASWFNNSSNWGTGTAQIKAGAVVHLCGAVSTDLKFQKSGASASYITVDGTGATYNGSFNTNSVSWWKVENVTFTGGKDMISIVGGANGVFNKNYGDNLTGGVFLMQGDGVNRPDNMLISNNYMRTTTADLGSEGQVDLVITEGSTNVIVEGNYLEMRTGGSGGGSQHDDCIQTWQKGSTNGGPPKNWTIRYNKLVMNSAAASDRSWMMLESLDGTVNIYGNVFLGLQGAENANGIAVNSNYSTVVFNIFNNTIVTKDSASNNVFNLTAPGTVNIRNNIIHMQGQMPITGTMKVNRDHNLWYGQDTPSCTGYTGELCNVNPLFKNYASNDFSLLVNSPAINTGLNLGTTYSGYVLPTSTWPGPVIGTRPSPGVWEMGAFEY
jgi:hypothetical protein